MEEKEIDINESLAIMQNMVKRAQNNISENGFMFIFWGWLVFVAATSFYVLLKIDSTAEYAWMVWLLMPLGGIVSAIYGFLKRRKEKARTYIDDYMGFVWSAFGISLIIIIIFGNKMQLNCYPVMIMLYAIATFITGGIIRFLPLIICGALSFPISIAAFLVSFDNQVLLLALSVLISYIIPGHWLQIKFRQQQNGI